jgi:hypothetical protein
MLQRTAERSGGVCIPCHNGTRAAIEDSKRRYAEERKRDRDNDAARARITSKAAPTLGDFLATDDPLGVLWLVLVRTVFSDGTHTAHVENLSRDARTVYFAQILEGEVINGGFSQFFSNSSGDNAHETLEALVEVGASTAARLLSKAIRTFPGGRVPRDRSARCQQLFQHEEHNSTFWDALDQEYYALLKADSPAEDLGELLVRFMSSHVSSAVAAA